MGYHEPTDEKPFLRRTPQFSKVQSRAEIWPINIRNEGIAFTSDWHSHSQTGQNGINTLVQAAYCQY